MDIAWILHILVPAAVYGGVPGTTESEYNKLRWGDARLKPTFDEIVEMWPAAQLLID